jgi:hypothetical protein
MSVPLTINGVTFSYPQEFDTHWGPTLTNWSSAVTTGMLQTSGVNAATYVKSATTTPAAAGFLRLAKTDTLSWRNNLGNADLALGINGSNQLTFNGTPIGASTALTNAHIFVGNVSNQPADVAMSGDATMANTGALTIANSAITDAKVSAAAAIALSKLAALTASMIAATDGSGFLTTTSACTLTELGYVSGVTSAIQTQLNTLTTSLGNYLPLSGGTLSGALSMGSHKITSVTQGSSSGEAISYPVSTSQISANAITQIQQSNNISSADAAGTDVTTVTITTTGGPVLLLSQVSLLGNRTSAISAPALRSQLINGSTVLTENYYASDSWANGTNRTISLSCCYIDTPVAGTYTYHLAYRVNAGTVSQISSYNLQAIELKR